MQNENPYENFADNVHEESYSREWVLQGQQPTDRPNFLDDLEDLEVLEDVEDLDDITLPFWYFFSEMTAMTKMVISTIVK
jgi:hypothetical protein